MNIVKERFEDAGEQDEHGLYDYYYAGSIYQIRFERLAFVIRQYEDTPSEAAFLNFQVREQDRWKRKRFRSVPYDSPEFREAVTYLVEHEGIRKVSVLLHGYTPVDLTRVSQTSEPV